MSSGSAPLSWLGVPPNHKPPTVHKPGPTVGGDSHTNLWGSLKTQRDKLNQAFFVRFHIITSHLINSSNCNKRKIQTQTWRRVLTSKFRDKTNLSIHIIMGMHLLSERVRISVTMTGKVFPKLSTIWLGVSSKMWDVPRKELPPRGLKKQRKKVFKSYCLTMSLLCVNLFLLPHGAKWSPEAGGDEETVLSV